MDYWKRAGLRHYIALALETEGKAERVRALDVAEAVIAAWEDESRSQLFQLRSSRASAVRLCSDNHALASMSTSDHGAFDPKP